MLDELEQSRRYCQCLTRRAAKNFYHGLRLLPPAKRSAMFALYAYMRLVDDIADEEDGRSPQQRLDELEKWRAQTHEVLAGRIPADNQHPIWPALAQTCGAIPRVVFDEVIEGQRQDLLPVAFETWEELRQYCYRVAGVVGLASIHIWGFEGGAETEAMAIDRGIALQLTNILRDLREDSARGRVYLPRSELAAVHVSGTDLLNGGDRLRGQAFDRLMRMQIERAESFYEKSSGLEQRVASDSRATLVAMTAIYRGVLEKVARNPDSVLDGKVSLSLASKMLIGWKALRAR